MKKLRFLKFLKIIGFVLAIAAFLYFISWQIDFSKSKPNWGVTFSQYFVQQELKIDWKNAYQTILEEIPVQKLRLIAYWQYLEPEKGQFNFQDLDWQIGEAQKKDKEVVLVVGYRVPRWPECHIPNWANNLPEEDFRKSVLTYLEEIINRYKSFPAIKIWQVENEPLFSLFGQCAKNDKEFLNQEIALVKSLDPQRPIMITDSGELSLWLNTAGLSEILGTTLYRVVWNENVGLWWKNIYPPVFYTARAFLAKKVFFTREVVISELQVEPWAPERKSITQIPFEQQIEHFSIKQLKNNLEFAKKTGIKDIYLWGVEWWYWRKINGDDRFWNFGKEFLKLSTERFL